jgi:hypothetical protein
MQIIENKHDIRITIAVDDKHFVNCHFTDCTLIYAGGDFGWTDTRFDRCNLQFAGAAGKTLAFLQQFGIKELPQGSTTLKGQEPQGPSSPLIQ